MNTFACNCVVYQVLFAIRGTYCICILNEDVVYQSLHISMEYVCYVWVLKSSRLGQEVLKRFLMFGHSFITVDEKNILFYLKVLICRIFECIFCFLQINDWKMSMENVEFSSAELWVIIGLQKKSICVWCRHWSTRLTQLWRSSGTPSSNMEISRLKIQQNLQFLNYLMLVNWQISAKRIAPETLEIFSCVFESQVGAKMVEGWPETILRRTSSSWFCSIFSKSSGNVLEWLITKICSPYHDLETQTTGMYWQYMKW